MTEDTLDIIALIQEHPLTKLSNYDYGSDIISKIKTKFSTNEQQLFIANFYCYLNYDIANIDNEKAKKTKKRNLIL